MFRTSLIDQSKSYVTPKDEALMNLYDSTMLRISQNQFDFKKNGILEDAAMVEN